AFCEENVVALDQASTLLQKARRIHVMGARSCLALGFFFHYASQLFTDKVLLHQGIADTLQDSLRFIESTDVLVAFTFEPYSKRMNRELRLAQQKKVPV